MAAPEVIDLDRLSPQDLDEVHRTVLLEIDALSQNITQLHTAHTKYRQSLQSVQSLVASKDDSMFFSFTDFCLYFFTFLYCFDFLTFNSHYTIIFFHFISIPLDLPY